VSDAPVVKGIRVVGHKPDGFVEVIDSLSIICLHSIGYTSIVIRSGEPSENLLACVDDGCASFDGEIRGVEVSR
jgi:hypothetical protein